MGPVNGKMFNTIIKYAKICRKRCCFSYKHPVGAMDVEGSEADDTGRLSSFPYGADSFWSELLFDLTKLL